MSCTSSRGWTSDRAPPATRRRCPRASTTTTALRHVREVEPVQDPELESAIERVAESLLVHRRRARRRAARRVRHLRALGARTPAAQRQQQPAAVTHTGVWALLRE